MAPYFFCQFLFGPAYNPFMQTNIEDRVKKIIIEQLGVDSQEVKLQANFFNDLGADSLDTVELVMALEEEFNITIEDTDADKITTVSQAIDYVKAHTEN